MSVYNFNPAAGKEISASDNETETLNGILPAVNATKLAADRINVSMKSLKLLTALCR